MDVKAIHKVFLVGIGGIGMSALARYFHARGAEVAGYDRGTTDLIKALQNEGITVSAEDDISKVNTDVDLVIYTPAISESNQILKWFREKGYKVHKRSEVLQWITASGLTIAVAGTHGKTTVSTMIAFLLRESGLSSHAFLGGISVNYNRNYWSGGDENLMVIEADEFDRSFLRLFPNIAVLTAMDADHLDVYGTKAELEKTFVAFTKNTKPEGTLFVKHGLPHISEMGGQEKFTYSLQNDAADFFATEITQDNGGYDFNCNGQDWVIENLRLNMGGMHNVENAVAAIAVLKKLGVESEVIKNVLPKFKGVKRRFEYIIRQEDLVYVDDYAHHPEELATLIKSAMRLFSKMKCVVVFQPHLFSRTRDFAEEFANSLDLADEVILLDIYPAREEPIDGVTAELIKNRMNTPCTILNKEGLLEWTKKAPVELLITAGAGDIDQLILPIKENLLTKN